MVFTYEVLKKMLITPLPYSEILICLRFADETELSAFSLTAEVAVVAAHRSVS